jgi:hypothetical protein
VEKATFTPLVFSTTARVVEAVTGEMGAFLQKVWWQNKWSHVLE